MADSLIAGEAANRGTAYGPSLFRAWHTRRVSDFKITVVANRDPAHGFVAEGADGHPAEAGDFEHVRAWVQGMLFNLAGGLPAGWDLRIEVTAPAGLQRDAPNLDPRRPLLEVVAPDRLAQIEVDDCSTCGGTLRRDRPDGIWYHVPDCADPTPSGRSAHAVTDGTTV